MLHFKIPQLLMSWACLYNWIILLFLSATTNSEAVLQILLKNIQFKYDHGGGGPLTKKCVCTTLEKCLKWGGGFIFSSSGQHQPPPRPFLNICWSKLQWQDNIWIYKTLKARTIIFWSCSFWPVNACLGIFHGLLVEMHISKALQSFFKAIFKISLGLNL